MTKPYAMENNGCTVMLIDDEPISNLINRKMLHWYHSGISIREFTDAEQALAALPDCAPHLIYLDLNMPVMDGWAFLDELQAAGHPHKVVILTSSTATADLEKSRTYGQVISYQLKPLTLDRIQDVLDHLLMHA